MNNKKDIIDSSDSDSEISSISYSSVSSSDLKKMKENPKIKNLINENLKQSDFDWKTYINNYEDLKNLTSKKEAWNHWIKHGRKENRTDKVLKTPEYDNFNWKEYISRYKDLKNIYSKDLAWYHWINHGKNEGRNWEEKYQDNQEYNLFDWKNYVKNYLDLSELISKETAWNHWINHGKAEGRTYENLKDHEYDIFPWEIYIDNYEDLKEIDNKEEAWKHWLLHGKDEGRVTVCIDKKQSSENHSENHSKNPSENKGKEDETITEKINITIEKNEIPETEINKVILKSNYEDYGLHFFGWRETINNFLDQFSNEENLVYNVFLDEWIEKLLLWGNKKENKKYIKFIKNNNYKLISFIHNPPVVKWNKNKQKIIKETLINDNYQFNENLFKKIKKNKLNENIVYLYTLSNHHKDYINHHYPEYKNKILSIYHPIDLVCEKEEYFNVDAFLKNKKIYHVGWWLRNFKTFNTIEFPSGFKKVLLIKDDFKNIWEEKFLSSKSKNIKIENELLNEEYSKIFNNSCIFLDLVDGTANNLVLECIKYNTPVFVKRVPSLEEYLGSDYPLFFKNQSQLEGWINNEINLIDAIKRATIYLSNINKDHIDLNTFNKKMEYDLSKLKVNNSLTKLSWITTYDDEKIDINNYIERFLLQSMWEEIKLVIVIVKDLFLNEPLISSDYINSYFNIEILECNKADLENQIEKLINETETEYAIHTNIKDEFNNHFSEKMIGYLDNNPACDLALSSYNSKIGDDNLQAFIYEKDKLFFKKNIPKQEFGRVMWRNNIKNIVSIPITIPISYSFLSHCIDKNLNIQCASSEPTYTISE
jgi:hypothetical protein